VKCCVGIRAKGRRMVTTWLLLIALIVTLVGVLELLDA
jgi:hypothetical protein